MRALKIVTMAKGVEIKIEPDELIKVLNARKTGSDVLLKQGLFNPSSYVGVVEDKDREKFREVDEFGGYTGKMHYEELPDIFEGIETLSQLKSSEIKKLTN